MTCISFIKLLYKMGHYILDIKYLAPSHTPINLFFSVSIDHLTSSRKYHNLASLAWQVPCYFIYMSTLWGNTSQIVFFRFGSRFPLLCIQTNSRTRKFFLFKIIIVGSIPWHLYYMVTHDRSHMYVERNCKFDLLKSLD